jgi:hypothetical protein
METITTINGNKQPMTKDMPRIEILIGHTINDVALAHITENTGLVFTPTAWNNYQTQPTESKQVAALLLTYDFKTQYHNNATNKNTLFLKFCNLEGFKVDTICFDCVKRNHIHANGLTGGDILAV